MNQQLQDYVKQAKESGISTEQIKDDLLKSGWSDSDINEAIDSIINQKGAGFSKKWIIPIFMVFALIAGSAVYYFYYFQRPSSDTNQLVIQETKPCNLENKEGNIIIQGKVVFPIGIKNKETYGIVGKNLESFPINSDRSFCAYAFQGKPTLITAVSDNENGFGIATIINSDSNVSDFAIDYKSTAVALVFLNPLLSSPELLIDTIPNNPDVIKFADKINSLTDLTVKDLEEGGRLEEDYINALKSVIESIKK